MSFASMLVGLHKDKIEFVVVGDVAGAVHGSPRVAEHLDILYNAADEPSIRRLTNLMSKWAAYPRGVESGLPFIMDARTLMACPIMTLSTREGNINLRNRIDGVGDYQSALKHSVSVSAFGVELRMLQTIGDR